MTRLIPYAGAERSKWLPGRKPSPGKPIGFAAMDPERVREISRLGNLALDAKQRPFSMNRAFAAECARKSAKLTFAEQRPFSNPEIAKAAGRKGGLAKAAKWRAAHEGSRDAAHHD